MNYKVILFDADETLFDFNKAEAEAFKNTVLEYKLPDSLEYYFNTYIEINDAIWDELEEGLITVEKLKIERFRRFLVKLNLNYDEYEFAETYIKHLSKGSFLLSGAESLVKDLSKKYILSIVTNGIQKVQEGRIKKSVIAHYFKDIIISEEVGVSKPNAAIFEHAVEKLGNFKKDEILMIGDNIKSDIRGGINFGIDTCWYNPSSSENKTDIKPTYEVNSYDDLRKLLL